MAVLWLVLLSPVGALLVLVCVQRFEAWMLAAVPLRARTGPGPSPRRRPPPATATTARPVLRPAERPLGPQRS